MATITKKTLQELRKAVRNTKTENDTFFITNGMFSCRWTGRSFLWVYPSGRVTEELNARQLLKRIPTIPYGDKRDITEYCYDYGNEPDTDLDDDYR